MEGEDEAEEWGYHERDNDAPSLMIPKTLIDVRL